jgi:ribonuclease J
MQLTIYRGTHQIGGCATEFRTGRARILIDLGSELPGPDGVQKDETMELMGITSGKPDCGGVFFTHNHGDHVGQIDRVLEGVPIYIGKTARDVALLVNRRINAAGDDRRGTTIAALERVNTFSPATPVVVGDIQVTPFCIDHSAFDAYMFLVEAEGIRVLHSGDFRLHGFRGRRTLPMLEKYVGQVDWLICEGTTMSRQNKHMETERELQSEARMLMEKYRRVFVLCSSTNIDRIAAFYHARPDNRPVVCDYFQKSVLDLVSNRYGHQSTLYNFRYVYPYSESNSKLLSLMNDRGFVAFIRSNEWSSKILEKYGNDATVVYSMWDGYLAGNTRLDNMLTGRRVERIHTSGHASQDDIIKLCNTINPRCGVIPIHSEAPDLFPKMMPNRYVKILSDGERFNLLGEKHEV